LQWKILSFQWTLQREKGLSKEGGVPQANTIQIGIKTQRAQHLEVDFHPKANFESCNSKMHQFFLKNYK
jgi:hypothetical protein